MDPDWEYSVHLIQAIDDSIDASKAEGERLARLTKWLIGLTVVLVVLTFAIVALTVVLILHGG